MFKLIGGVLVYGLALFGVVKLLDRPSLKIEVSAKPGSQAKAEQTREADPSQA